MANKLKILHISTHHEPCGIGKFQEKCIDALNDSNKTANEFYVLSLNKIKVMDNPTRRKELKAIAEKSKKFDVVHIQHEFGFFADTGTGFNELVNVLKGKVPIAVTIHTAPELLLLQTGYNLRSPRSVAGHIVRSRKNRKTKKYKFLPFSEVDKIITFNNFTRQQLIDLAQVKPENIYKTMLPVPQTKIAKSNKLRRVMGADADDTILCTTGFINEYKGFDHAVKALKYLPDNYKLAILGGLNPDSGNPAVFDQLCDLILTLNLENRVYISGYIESDEELAELMNGCDIALYPYSVDYYRMASSDAINKAISINLPIIAYPTQSFKEINKAQENVLHLTKSPNYYELVKAIQDVDRKKLISNEKKYSEKYNYKQIASELETIYSNLVKSN